MQLQELCKLVQSGAITLNHLSPKVRQLWTLGIPFNGKYVQPVYVPTHNVQVKNFAHIGCSVLLPVNNLAQV